MQPKKYRCKHCNKDVSKATFYAHLKRYAPIDEEDRWVDDINVKDNFKHREEDHQAAGPTGAPGNTTVRHADAPEACDSGSQNQDKPAECSDGKSPLIEQLVTKLKQLLSSSPTGGSYLFAYGQPSRVVFCCYSFMPNSLFSTVLCFEVSIHPTCSVHLTANACLYLPLACSV